MLSHRVPGHLGPPGDDAVIGFLRVEPHVLPDLPLLLCKFVRRRDPTHPVLDGLPLCIHLLDEHLQLLLALLTGMGVDAFGVLGAVRPGGRVAPLKEMAVEFRDAPGSRLSGAPGHRLKVGEGILRRLWGFRRHLVAQATVNLGGGFTEHIAGDVRINVQRGRRRHMAQHGGEGLDVHAVFQGHGGEGVAQIVEADLLTPGPLQNDLEPPKHRARRQRQIWVLR